MSFSLLSEGSRLGLSAGDVREAAFTAEKPTGSECAGVIFLTVGPWYSTTTKASKSRDIGVVGSGAATAIVMNTRFNEVEKPYKSSVLNTGRYNTFTQDLFIGAAKLSG